jgi:predicted 3-demethylubiquinone-9 3-methyltransferase (glyoxalase superfamily)
MAIVQRIAPCLWFDTQAEAAALHYVSIFKNARIVTLTRYGAAGFEVHGQPAGSVMTVEFELEGQPFTAINGGPAFTFNEAVSLQVNCETQAEIDYYWDALAAGGDPEAQRCGWLKDKFGVSWQVVPTTLAYLFADHTSGRAQRAMTALLKMKKLNIADLERAAGE